MSRSLAALQSMDKNFVQLRNNTVRVIFRPVLIEEPAYECGMLGCKIHGGMGGGPGGGG
jgi:hypothetical protein